MKTEDILKTIKGSANHDFLIDVIDCATERRAYLIKLVKGLKFVRVDVEEGLDPFESIELRFESWNVPEEVAHLYLRIEKGPKEDVIAAIDALLEKVGCHAE